MTDELRPHDLIRQALSERLGRSRALDDDAQYAAALAVAVHPWPDEELDSDLLEELLGELDPQANIPSRDVREVAADRLYRLIEVCARYGDEGARLSERYRAALDLIEEQISADTAPASTDELSAVIVTPAGCLASGDEGEGEGVEGGDDLAEEDAVDPLDERALSEVLRRVVNSGTADLGLCLGHEATGGEVGAVLSFPDDRGVLGDLEGFFEGLDERTKTILSARSPLAAESTLEELGERLDVTRERVRQLEAKARMRVEETYARRLAEVCEPLSLLRGKVVLTSGLIAAAKTLATGLSHRALIADCIIIALGPWTSEGEWAVHGDVPTELPRTQGEVSGYADSYRLLGDEEMERAFGALFLGEASRDRYARERLKMWKLEDVWMLRDSRRGRVLAALRVIGRSATKEEIALVAGVDITSGDRPTSRVGSYLSSVEGIVRADKDRWGFSEWVERPYKGVANQIGEMIDEAGGECSVSAIRGRLIDDFGIAESTVDTYLSCDAFDWQGSVVRRSQAPYKAGDPAKVSGSVLLDDLWGQLVTVQKQHLNGYSFNVHQDIAHANGVRIDDDLLVALEGGDGEVSLIWNRAMLGRSVFVGRLRAHLEESEAELGAELFLFPTRERVVVKRVTELPPELQERLLGGDDYE